VNLDRTTPIEYETCEYLVNCVSVSVFQYRDYSNPNWEQVPVFIEAELPNTMLNRKLEDGSILDYTQIILNGYVHYCKDYYNEEYYDDYFSIDITKQMKSIKGNSGTHGFMICGTCCFIKEPGTPVHTFSAKVDVSLKDNYEWTLEGISSIKVDNTILDGSKVIDYAHRLNNVRCRTILASGIEQLCE
jgi:hypothetical protein